MKSEIGHYRCNPSFNEPCEFRSRKDRECFCNGTCNQKEWKEKRGVNAKQ